MVIKEFRSARSRIQGQNCNKFIKIIVYFKCFLYFTFVSSSSLPRCQSTHAHPHPHTTHTHPCTPQPPPPPPDKGFGQQEGLHLGSWTELHLIDKQRTTTAGVRIGWTAHICVFIRIIIRVSDTSAGGQYSTRITRVMPHNECSR